MEEPGLDVHEWESRWQQLAPLVEDSPIEALPELVRLIEGMVDDSGAGEVDAEIGAELAEARIVAERVERGEDVDPGDVAAAVDGLRSIHDHVVARQAGL